VVPAAGAEYELPGKANVRLGRGDLVIVESCGGGGYGAPTPDSATGNSA
jgi:N-methylhydantoinase B/oxoprolinase/acetone carboxylase alpha subunit